MKMGTYLKNIRLNAKMTLRGITEKTGLHFTYLSMIENNLRKPDSLEMIKRIGQAYGIPADQLIKLWYKS